MKVRVIEIPWVRKEIRDWLEENRVVVASKPEEHGLKADPYRVLVELPKELQIEGDPGPLVLLDNEWEEVLEEE